MTQPSSRHGQSVPLSQDGSRIVLFGFQFFHHGPRAGFWPLAAALRDYARVVDITPGFARRFSPRWQARVCRRWYRWGEYRVRSPLGTDGRVVHYFFPENTLFKGAMWKTGGCRLVLTCHQPVGSDFFQGRHVIQPGFVKGLRAADAVVLMAPTEMETYQAEAPQARICFIPYGVDVDFFDPAAEPPADSSRPFTVLTAGNWLRDYACWGRIVAEFVKTRIPCEFIVVANEKTVETARAYLDPGAEQAARFLCRISDEELRRLYHQADAVLLPLRDAWANTALLEAMAMGKTLIVTDLPAVRIYAGPDAFYFNNDRPKAAVDYLFYLATHPDAGLPMGAALRAKARTEFAWNIIADRYRTLYQSLSS